jgi:hypothetical protein
MKPALLTLIFGFLLGCSSTPIESSNAPLGRYPIGTKVCPVHGATLERVFLMTTRQGCIAMDFLECEKCTETMRKNSN